MNLEQNTHKVDDNIFKAILRTYEKLKVKDQLKVSLTVWIFISVIGLLLALPAFRVEKSSYLNPSCLSEDSHSPH
jgi:hypothetical protein